MRQKSTKRGCYLLQICNILGRLFGIVSCKSIGFIFLLKMKGAEIMPRKKNVKELDAEIERLKRQVEIEGLKKQLTDKKKKR